jgi:hypothetical protein
MLKVDEKSILQAFISHTFHANYWSMLKISLNASAISNQFISRSLFYPTLHGENDVGVTDC